MFRPALARAVLAAAIAVGGVAAPASAASPGITSKPSTREVLLGRTFHLFGTITPAASGVTVTRQVYRDNAWKSTGTAATNRKGDYRMTVTAPAWAERLKLRVRATVQGKLVTSAVVYVNAVKSLTPTPTPTPTPTLTPTKSATPTPTPSATTATPSPTPTPSPTVDTSTTITDTTTVSETPTVTETVTPTVVMAGPGKRILGVDISRYQHPTSTLFPNGAPIDFKTMYKTGVRFLMIKASDGRDNGHNNAATWYAQDRADAQKAGIYTGFYHYAYFPVSTAKADIIADAEAQADKAIWRLASVGGYNTMDLPYALDVEEWCFITNDNGACLSRVTKASATLWVKTWLARVTAKTGRKPFVYSSASFLQNYLNRDTVLRGYPLWIAHAGLKPADATNYPGMKSDGTCYIHAWTLSSCRPQWSIWQYGVMANEGKYGIAGGNVDVNVFSGTGADLRALTQGVWQPAAGDFLPFNETTTTTVTNLSFGLITQPVTFTADVRRITGGPVVSGTVTFQLLANDSGTAPTAAQISAIRQSVKRTASGTWTVSVTGLPAGMWFGQVVFRDTSGVHAQSSFRVQMLLIDPNPPVTPAPTPTPDTATVTDTTTAAAVTPAPTPSPTA